MHTEFLYMESQILCILFTAVVLKLNETFLQDKFKYITVIGVLSILASIADILGLVFQNDAFFVQAFKIIYLTSFAIMGYLWFLFCLQQFGIEARFIKWISLLPVPVAIALAAFNARNGGVLMYIYVLGTYVVAFLAARKAQSTKMGHEYAFLASVSTPILLSGIQSVVRPDGLNTQSYAVLLSILMLSIVYQRKKMVTDNLTELPNRYGMDAEIEEQLRQYKKDKNDSFYVIVCDMDNFKTINDTWGHLEGDRALKLIAGVLEEVAEQYDSEVFRIGGDEFVVITDTSESGLAEEICASLKEGLDAIDFRDDYDICMSMGVSLYDGKCTIAEMINSADRKLYQAKQKNKESTGTV